MTEPTDTVELFLRGADVIATALADASVAAAWDDPSVLEHQLVSGLAGHLARGAVWVVADYLDGGEPDGPMDFATAGEYFATIMGDASPGDHQAIRARGADVGAIGPHALVERLHRRLDALAPRLRSLPASQRIAVAGGNVMRLEDYLRTRVVEQVVHLDDLARSVDHDPWLMPAPSIDVAITVGAEIARRRSGSAAVIRALYRRGFATAALPVL